LFLFCFSIQNVAEIFGLYRINTDNVVVYFDGAVFYASLILAFAFFFNLALAIAFDDLRGRKQALINAVYGYAVVLVILLIFSRLVIRDFEALNYGSFGNSATRIPGPLFFLVEIYLLAFLIGSSAVLVYGARTQTSALKRTKCSVLLSAILPIVVLGATIVTLLHLGIKLFNASVTFPIAITYFLAVTAYGIYQHRIFDIQFFIPWSKVRKRKTAFYSRLRAMIAEIADVSSVNQAINLLADVLRCPVALISGPRPVLAISGSSADMIRFPLKELRRVDSILVANEIGDAMPSMHMLMREHGVAAIVPFHPHSQTAASWMLLGESFSDQVYTPLDFKMVEQVFDRLGDLFLDKLLFMRSQLHEAREQLQTLQLRLDVAEEQNRELRGRVRKLLRDGGSAGRARPGGMRRGKSDKAAPVVKLVPKKPAREAGTQTREEPED
jgi:hypothetical protein